MAKKDVDLMPVPEESVEQIDLFRWAEFQMGKWPELRLMYAIPNGGKRYKATAVRLKMEGVKSGVPDICLPVARGHYHGLYIEMKRQRGGSVSESQKEWLADLKAQGYLAIVCKGWLPASEEIQRYMRLPPWNSVE